MSRRVVTVVVETGFGVVILRRETVAEEICERARLRDDFAEGIVCVLRYRIAVRVKIASDVADIVVAGNVKLLS